MSASARIGDAAAAVLPAGFRHPHASEEARRIAERGLILRTQVGSGVHGTSISGQDDRDEMGICLEPPEFVTGLARVPNGVDGASPSVRFEQCQRHTVWDEPGGLANRSAAGDLDVVVHSARKWCRLALGGNPTVLLVLFVPDDEVVFRNDAGAELVDNADRFVSQQAAERFLGYLQAQRAAMTGEVGAHTNRPELVAVHGYDTKYAMHALRLGLQGVQLLSTGRITLPAPEPGREYLRSVRPGEVPLDEAIQSDTCVTGQLDGAVLAVLAGAGTPLTVGQVTERSTRGSEIGIRRSLARLTAESLVRATLMGRNQVHELNRDYIAAGIAVELAGLRTELRRRFRKELRTWRAAPAHGCVRGAAARGDGNDESDIDLLVVLAWRLRLRSWPASPPRRPCAPFGWARFTAAAAANRPPRRRLVLGTGHTGRAEGVGRFCAYRPARSRRLRRSRLSVWGQHVTVSSQ